MANVIKHKRGSGSDPSASDLILGELAIRTDTGKLFTKMDSGAIAEIAGGGSDIAINTLSSSSGTGGGSATFNGSAYRFTLSAPPSVSAAQLLVSINGVIQKPVAGTGQPSEGFSVDGTDIILGDAPATGSDFFILTFKSLGVSEPADNSVTSAKIVDGAIVNADINASAAIAGSKISPDFGSQAIATTGSATIGTDLIHAGDTDTKLSFGDNEITLNTAGSERLELDINEATFNDGGNDTDFRIRTPAQTHMFYVDAGNNQIGIKTSSPASGAELTVNGRTHTDTQFTIGSNSTLDAGVQATIYKPATNTLAFATAGANERMRIDSSGNVGIGTSSPATIFHVKTFNPDVYLENTGTGTGQLRVGHFTNGAFIGTYNDDGGGSDVLRLGTHSGDERMRIGSDGKIAIGTTATSMNGNGLKIFHANFPSLQLQNNATGTGATVGAEFILSTGGALQIVQRSNEATIFKTANTERMRIKNDGDILLTRPTAGSGANETLEITANYGAGSDQAIVASNNFRIYTNGANERLRIDTSGKVGIGRTSPNEALEIAGSVYLTSNTSNANEGNALKFQSKTGGFNTSYGAAIHGLRVGDTSSYLRFDTGGQSEKMRLDSTGRLLLGTTTVGAKSAASPLQIQTADSGAFALTIKNRSSNNDYSFIGFTDDDASEDLCQIGVQRTAANTGDIFFYTNGGSSSSTERMRIGANGNVSIGTTSTSFHKLEVSNGSDQDNIIVARGADSTTEYAAMGVTGGNAVFTAGGVGSTNTGMVLRTAASGSETERMRITAAGKVDINSDSSGPDRLLHVSDNNAGGVVTPFRLTNVAGTSGTEVRMEFECGLDEIAYIGAKHEGSDVGPLIFATATSQTAYPTEKMRLTNNGHLFHGCTSSPDSSDPGTAIIADANQGQILIATNSTAQAVLMQFKNPNGGVGDIRTSGSGIIINGTSDYRVKENAVAISDGITRLKTLKPYRFNFKADPTKTLDGFFAHEVTSAVPEAVTGTKDEIATEDNDLRGFKKGDPILQGIDQSKLVPLLVAALQEAIGRIEALEAK